ncbi:unnamed protein product [Closterium sp. NIES-65]|nr:unnamed protein product [Closterium sp. NIES-65]
MPFCAVPAPPMWPAFAQVPPNAARAAAPPGVTPGTATYPGWSLLLEEAVSPVGWQANSSLLLLLPQCRGNMRGFTVNATLADAITLPVRVECVDVDTVWRDTQTDIDSEVYAGHYQANPEQATNAYTAAFDFQDTGPTRYNPVIQYNSSYNNASIGGTPATLLRFARLLNLASNAFIKSFHGGDELNTASAPATAPTPAVAPAEIPLLFVKDFPKVETTLGVDFVSLLGPLFYMWVLQLLLPVMTVALVYEKEQQLRIMMRMHGLKDGPYWLVSYLYFLLLSLAYIFFLVAFGSLIRTFPLSPSPPSYSPRALHANTLHFLLLSLAYIFFLVAFGSLIQLESFTLNPYGLQFLLYIVPANTQILYSSLPHSPTLPPSPAELKCFTLNPYGLQLLLYIVSANTQIALAMLLSTAFAHTRPATATTYLYVFTSALLGQFLYRNLLESGSYSSEYRGIPSFSLAPCHTHPPTAATYLYVFTSALLGQFLYRNLLESGSYSSEYRGIPSFSLAPCHTHPPTAATYLYVFTSALLGQFLYRNLLESGSYSSEYRHPMARDEVSTGPFSGGDTNFLSARKNESCSDSTTFMTALQLFPAVMLNHGVYDHIHDCSTALPSGHAQQRATFMTALQLFPAFALYHGVYELTQSSLIGSYQASQGTLTWATAATNGYLTAVAIQAVEWLVFLLLAIYLDQVVSAGSGVRKHPLFFLRGCKSGCRKLLGSLKKVLQSCRLGGDARVHAAFQEGSWRNEEGKEWKAGAAESGKAEWGEGEVGGGVVGAGHGTDVGEEKEKAKGCLDRFDVDLESLEGSGMLGPNGAWEECLGLNHLSSLLPPPSLCPLSIPPPQKRKVQHLLHTGTTPDPSAHHSILCAGLSKVYPSRDGGAPKEAVAGMWLGVARGECLGVLGPNGAGKTTALRMMMGFLQPSGGTAIIEGMGIAEEMDSIYSIMGVACLGTLGANGAGKTTALRMMMGFLQPSGDTAAIKGMGIAEEMDWIYSTMGVCPQHDSSLFSPFLPPHPSLVPILSPLFQPPMGAADRSRPPSLLRAAQEFASLSAAVEASLSGGHQLREADKPVQQYSGCMKQRRLLWEQLTGREHLMFYGRLKNLRGSALTSAVEASLSGVHLLKEADKPVQQYSGGMKRRLSVAISLIGDPLVVYMDEPSTGLDPSSRMHLWNVVKRAKKHCAIVLTTHSMEEADALCDRMGIFVRGEFVCIGSAQELTARYGGRFIFTLTTPVDYEAAAARLALSLSVNARRIYNLSGTQKFELPVEDVRISDVFAAVQAAKGTMPIQAWGLTNSTLEDVFIKVAKQAHANVV